MIRAHFKIGRLHIMQFMKWIELSNTVLVQKNVDLMKAEAGARAEFLNTLMFAVFPGLNPIMIGTELALRILKASFAIGANAQKDPCFCGFFSTFHRFRPSFVALIIKSRFLHHVFNSACRGALAMLHIIASSIFEVNIVLHRTAMEKKAIRQKALELF